MGFNFGQIGNIIGKIMDTDEMDISRKGTEQLPNSSWVETDSDVPVHENVPFHLSFTTKDNPDPTSDDVQTVIRTMAIHCDISVDLREGDLVTARKLSHNGDVLKTYRAIIGAPETNQAGKSAVMGVHAL